MFFILLLSLQLLYPGRRGTFTNPWIQKLTTAFVPTPLQVWKEMDVSVISPMKQLMVSQALVTQGHALQRDYRVI